MKVKLTHSFREKGWGTVMMVSPINLRSFVVLRIDKNCILHIKELVIGVSFSKISWRMVLQRLIKIIEEEEG